MAGPAQPTIPDGVRGEGIPAYSVLGPDRHFAGVRVQTLHGYSAVIPLIIVVPGREPYRVDVLRWMTFDKFPIAGLALPVTVDRADPAVVRIEWDEVPDVEELIRANALIFSDPDRVAVELRDLNQRATATAVDQVDEQLDDYARSFGSSLEAGQFAGMLHALRGELDTSSGATPVRIPPDQPSARVLAHTMPRWNQADGSSGIPLSGSRMLLSVNDPGKPRYGYLWQGVMHTRRAFTSWSDIPITIDRNGSVDVEWNQMETTTDYALGQLQRAGAQTQAAIDALGTSDADMMRRLIDSAVPESRRAEVEAQLAQADRAAQLQQLAARHAAGALTDDEYRAERRRVLDQI